MRDFPDSPFLAGARQSYFIGLAFTSDDHYLYASVASITDPIDEKRGDTWNGIVVYRFDKGKLKPARFIPISPQKLAPGKRVAKELSTSPAGTAVPYPAGLAAISVNGRDEWLVANDRSDNVVLLDTQTGKTLQQFDVSTNNVIPASFPYGVVAKRDGTRAWCSLWNASKVGGLDLAPGMCWISLLEPKDPTLPGSHPTALMLDESLCRYSRFSYSSPQSGRDPGLVETRNLERGTRRETCLNCARRFGPRCLRIPPGPLWLKGFADL